MEACLEAISVQYPCRENLLKELYQLFDHNCNCYPPSLLLHGARGIGKTSIFMKLLNYLSIRHAFVDCVEHYTMKMLYANIINQLRNHTISSNNNFENYAPCVSSDDFITELNALDSTQSYVIVLKNFHRLCDVNAYILPILMRFDTLVPGINIACVLITSRTSTQYLSQQNLAPCVDIYCEQYSKNELLQILMLDVDRLKHTMLNLIDKSSADAETKQNKLTILNDLNEDFYVLYFNLFIDTFFAICRNVKELQYISNANFPLFCMPVIEGTIRPNDRWKLYKNMEQPFKTAMNLIYCRVDRVNASINNADDGEKLTLSTSARSGIQRLELPFYTKYLLIAAYLASHNDAKLDRRLFMKHHGKQKKRVQSIRAKAVSSDKLSTQIGPKSFNIDRLMAIFYSIIDEQLPLTTNLLMQISNLVRLKYLSFVSGECNIVDGTARLQCNVALDFIKMVGKQVGFDVLRYLADFM